MERADLDNRFTYHPPTPVRARSHENIREVFRGVAQSMNGMLPEGREKALAITKLEEAMFWANAAIARSA